MTHHGPLLDQPHSAVSCMHYILIVLVGLASLQCCMLLAGTILGRRISLTHMGTSVLWLLLASTANPSKILPCGCTFTMTKVGVMELLLWEPLQLYPISLDLDGISAFHMLQPTIT